MGHARYDELRDLEDIFAVIRTLPGISEPTAGTFALRRKPFLHFHAPKPVEASVAVLIDPSLTEARIVRPGSSGGPPGLIKVNIGESSIELLKLSLPKLFETVVFVNSKTDADGYDTSSSTQADVLVFQKTTRPETIAWEERR